MQDIIPIVLQFYPQLAKWLCDDTTMSIENAIIDAIKSIQGSGTAVTVDSLNLIINNQDEAANLKLQFAKIIRDQEEVMRQDNLNDIKTLLATATTSTQASSPPTPSWQTKFLSVVPILSVMVLLMFSLTLYYVLTHSEIGNFAAGMVGTLGTMTMTVIAYWFGSSLGSTQKSEMIHQMANNPVILSNQGNSPQNFNARFIGSREALINTVKQAK
jgi:hypothetical protein